MRTIMRDNDDDDEVTTIQTERLVAYFAAYAAPTACK